MTAVPGTGWAGVWSTWLRRNFSVNVVAVSLADGSVDVLPQPTRVFTPGDKVTIIGTDKDIDRLMKQLK